MMEFILSNLSFGQVTISALEVPKVPTHRLTIDAGYVYNIWCSHCSLISVNLFSNQPPKTIAIAIAFPVVATGFPPVVITPSTAKLSTAVTAVSIVVVVPLTVRSPVTVRAPPTVPSLVTTSVPIVPVISPNAVEPETSNVPVSNNT